MQTQPNRETRSYGRNEEASPPSSEGSTKAGTPPGRLRLGLTRPWMMGTSRLFQTSEIPPESD